MTVSPTKHLLRADLETVRLRTPVGVGRQMTWTIAIGSGAEAAGDAGVATLSPPGSGLRVDFDYATPGKLLALRVPCGFVAEDPDSVSEDLLAPRRPRLSPADAAVFDALVGVEVRRGLETPGAREFACIVEASPRWGHAGLLALLQTSVADSARPLDGLWAAEAASLVRSLGVGEALAAWSHTLVEGAVTALRLLPVSLVSDAGIHGKTLSRLHQVLLACREISDQDLGPLASALRKADAAAVLENADTWLKTVERQFEEYSEAAAHETRSLAALEVSAVRGRRLRARRGGTHSPRERVEERAQAMVDDSAADTVADATWVIAGNHLEVRVRLRDGRWPGSFSRRIMVRATTLDGVLVAAGLSMRSTDTGRLEAGLTLPLTVDPRTLFVCVGRHLPVAPLTAAQFEQRQALHKHRQETDRQRPKFLAEQLSTLVPLDAVKVQLSLSKDLRRFSGARSLVWAAGALGQAAVFEQERLQADGVPELTLEQSDQLIKAAALGRNESLAEELDRQATAFHYDLIA